ncbi:MULTISPECIES: OPT family oligopeptide transporter [Corallincola]|uniref:Oligopeptide transporter OPT family protein n=2 Tax=Corallincola TaxID=1775176 RepID=A0A368N3G5_9GAMM|nr:MULTISPECIES: OPT/YSL family transporter [Corallincola]RCU45107.1 oligopeptide transporter OPT family protein [Corallincola holothuriorum]TAA46847.1 oligopeptide transporter OPT family protein [Corallincola spongiicola]
MKQTDTVVRHGPYPELTLPAVLVGYFLGAIIAISIGYAALILGFSIEGSELAAILGFAVLRGMLGRHSIVENNVTQTVASAVNGASSGMMFSVPALFILGYTDFDPVLLTFGCIAGAFLGIAFIIPLRKQMIDYERLTYPGGVAVATILKSPGAGVQKAKLLVGAAAVAALVHFGSQMGGVDNWDLGALIGLPEYMNGVWYLSLLTVGVGFIAGRGGIAFILGGFVCYWLLAPLLSGFDLLPLDAAGNPVTLPNALRVDLFRPVGIGMLIGGALMGIALALPLIISAIRSMQSAAVSKSVVSKDEMPIKLLYIAIVAAAILLAVMSILSTEHMGLGRGLLMAVMGTLWIWIAGVILSEAIGRTNWSPLSGMTLIAVTILIIIAKGLGDAEAVIAAVTLGAAVCVAMSQATDLMLDLKTGYLVGATPKMQQMGQFLGAWLGPLLVIGLIMVLHEAYGLGSEKLPAPQGQALASMISGILGGDIPTEKYLAGAGIGALLSALSGGLGITVGLGFYLPFNIVLTYALGTLLRELCDRYKGDAYSESVGIPIAAGLIVGEALIGVGFAVSYVMEGL